MNTFNVSTEKGKLRVSLPTSIDEISTEYLKAVTRHIRVGNEYSLVAIVYKTNTAMLLNASKQKDAVTSVIPLFIKSGKTEDEFINSLDIKDVLTITGSDIAMGIHVGNPYNELSMSRIASIFKEDSDIVKASFTDKTMYYFVEFKLIPNCNIHATVAKNVAPGTFIEVEQ